LPRASALALVAHCVVVHFCIPPNIPQKFRNAPYNHPMRHIVFGHQFANESLAKRPIVSPLLHMSKMIAGDFPSVRKSKLALSARPLAPAAPTSKFLSTRHRQTLRARHDWSIRSRPINRGTMSA
jgi:hypothetical protein